MKVWRYLPDFFIQGRVRLYVTVKGGKSVNEETDFSHSRLVIL